MTTSLRVGAHLSTAGGTPKAIARAVDLGCSALQIFTQAPGRWKGREIPAAEAEQFRADQDEAGLAGFAFAHAPYLINPAAEDEALRERSRQLLVAQLDSVAALGLAGLVLHPGAHTGAGVDVGLQRAAASIASALDEASDDARLLLEITAGQGTTLGRTFSELAALLEALPADRVGVCWDTAHLWAAGYDIASADGWERTVAEAAEATGRPTPDLIHLNDTDKDLGSHRDRHQRIGHGQLGEATFARVVTDSRFAAVPMVIETPKGPDGSDDPTWDAEALTLLRKLAGER